MKKNILFVTGTRADFGKLKSIIKLVKSNKKFNTFIAITGMHLLKEAEAYTEVEKSFKKNIFKFKNQSIGDDLKLFLKTR